METNTLSPEVLERIDALPGAPPTISQSAKSTLYDNPLLKRPLELADIKRMLLGHWGTTAWAELHLRAPEPGHQKV